MSLTLVYNPINLVTMTTKVPTGRGPVYCLQFSISLFFRIFIFSYFHPCICLSIRHKNFNQGNNFLTIIGRVLIFHTCIPCDETFPLVSTFNFVTFTVTFGLHLTYIFKTLLLIITFLL